MPITGPSSFLPTMDLFLAHWSQVNATLGGAGPLVLTGGTDRVALLTARSVLEAARDAVTDGLTDRGLKRSALNALVLDLHDRLVEFNERVRSDLPGSEFEQNLPAVFAIGDGQDAVRTALRVASLLWARIDAMGSPPAGVVLPLELRGGYEVADLNTQRNILRDYYTALQAADLDLVLARSRRNAEQDVIYAILKNYRLKVGATFAPGDALVLTLPALTPPEGHTPVGVEMTAVWDGVSSKAKITWDASTDPDLAEYQVAGEPGESYDSDDEVRLGTVPAGGTREFFSDFALGSAGLTSGFKVYTVLEDGREKGSEAAYVTRPG